MNDNEIVDLFLVRDEGAIDETAIKYGVRLRSLAYGIIQDFETAEECEHRDNNQCVNPTEQCPAEGNQFGEFEVFVGVEFIIIV